ncbi:hypothetical protein [Inquilinus limosus]|uniref:Mor transcription activator domain-containing protein n=1 Tax=Inquilinus limosus MP06 TaxID=1398085 RepID=A0A0A0DCH4_9PROT|nr:hypothetical protein [Inquilinus limosus]KGM35725.1 hypothetical protein P409_02790 [Inquilinus limosus MP06]
MSETFTPEYFPGLLYDLAVRGYAKEARALAKVWGGGKRYIPSLDHVRPTSPLVGIIGLAATRVLAELHGPGHKLIPRAVGESALMREILNHPGATRACARDLGCTEEWVRRVRLRRGQGDARQGDLFGDPTSAS